MVTVLEQCSYGVQRAQKSYADRATDAPTRHEGMNESRAAAIIEGIRADLEDCGCVTDELRHKAMKIARDFAISLSKEHFDGVSIFCDPDDGSTEIIIDNLRNLRRLTVDLRPDGTLRVSQVSPAEIQRSEWLRTLYDVPALSKWLMA